MLPGLMQNPEYDVVVVGSGAGGMVSALRAHDLGLRVIVLEKSDRYGGTSAVSGAGLWIPYNPFIQDRDSPEQALQYLISTTEGRAPEDMLRRYVELGPKVIDYLKDVGVEYYVNENLHYPDYHPDHPGALPHGRAMFVRPFDGATLGDEFFNLRESYPEFKLLDRITIDLDEGSAMIHKKRGWMMMLVKQLARYWLDIPWRGKTHRDRRLAHGNALVGGLRKAMIERGIPLALKTRMVGLISEDGRISGVVVESDGQKIRIAASRGVVLAAGGYEQSEQLRERYLPSPSQTSWSVTPRGNNTGDAFRVAQDAGAAIQEDMLDQCWWAPSIAFPSKATPNITRSVGIFFERGFPHSVCVNRKGRRFVNEAVSYHQFGAAMIADQKANDANLPCWIIFDSRYRRKYPLGWLLPGQVMPDSKLPRNWLDNVLYRADTLDTLAAKIGLPAKELNATVSRFNGFAKSGVDEDFGRGSDFYNAFLGDPKHKPNSCLGEVAKAPFYAVRFDLGDLGSKGGPTTDVNGSVIDKEGKPIPGLYAVGNCARSIMGHAYPGAGVTLGSAMIFGYAAASNMARPNDTAVDTASLVSA